MNIVVPILIMFVIGSVAGLLVRNSHLMRGRGFGMEGSIIAGVLGSFAGGLANMGGITKSLFGFKIGGAIGSLIWAAAGAVIVLFIIALIKKDQKNY